MHYLMDDRDDRRTDSANVGDNRSEADTSTVQSLLASARSYMRHVWDRASQGGVVDPLDALPLVTRLATCLKSDQSSLLSAASLARCDDYEVDHGVGVTVRSLLFGQSMGLDDEVLQVLGLAGLHHDLGKARLPSYLLAKPGKLRPWEFALVKRHPHESCRALRTGGSLRRKVADAVMDHHERFDGSGYPRGLSGKAINPCSRVVAMADTFDALISDRTHQQATAPTKALGMMLRESGRQFDPSWTAWFVKSLGVYPPGSLVRLSDKRVAVVRRMNPHSPLQPVVALLYDAAGNPMEPEDLDLAPTPVRVERCLEPGRFGIPGAALLLLMGK